MGFWDAKGTCGPFNRVTKPEWYPPCYDNLSRVWCVRDEAEIHSPGPLLDFIRIIDIDTVIIITIIFFGTEILVVMFSLFLYDREKHCKL